jgi:Na+/citrate or Na+/malate symporter
VVGAVAATLVGAAVGLRPFDTLFLIVVPLMGGGISAGALPLSIGYASALGQPQGALLAAMLPAVVLGNLVAMIVAGLLDFWERKPWAKQALRLQAGERLVGDENPIAGEPPAPNSKRNIRTLGAAAVVVAALYAAGWLASRLLGLPAPLTALILAAILQLTDALPPYVRTGVLAIYRFCVATFTYPVLFAAGLLLTPWEKLIEGFAPANLATILAAVGSLSIAGYFVSRRVGPHPVDGAMVTVTRAAMGGTGDVAILSAGRRMELMPFALISTRIGGLATVAAALIAVEHFAR